MKFTENVLLAHHTTFKIGGPARFFCIVSNEDELVQAVAFAKKEKRRIMILGGGSNVLFADAGFSGVVAKMEMKGIEILDPHPKTGQASADESVFVSCQAGEMWDDLVDRTVSLGLYGLENLSAIPGTVGAAPVQNIGAYGTELSDTVEKVRALDTETMAFVELSNAECGFGYRDSLFKQTKGRYVITRVDFKLRKNGTPNLGYKDLKEYFRSKGAKDADRVPSLQEVRDAVIDIRWKKLPDWKLWGTAGSFFKNPVIAAHRFEALKKKYPGIPGYPEPDGRVKVSAGWILDNVCKVKGVMPGKVGTYENQALVIIAKPGATAAEVIEFTEHLLNQVEKETTIRMEGEVEWVN